MCLIKNRPPGKSETYCRSHLRQRADLQLEIAENVTVLFDALPYWTNPDEIDYDIYPDERLLMLNQRDEDSRRSTIRVIENWFLDLNELAEGNSVSAGG